MYQGGFESRPVRILKKSLETFSLKCSRFFYFINAKRGVQLVRMLQCQLKVGNRTGHIQSAWFLPDLFKHFGVNYSLNPDHGCYYIELAFP